jgi:hypothetical protein
VQLLTEFAVRIGWFPSDSKGLSFEAAADGYFMNHPPHPVLLREFRALMGEETDPGKVGPYLQLPFPLRA